MDEALIVVSLISGMFGLMGLLLLDRNWFRRERFKLTRDTQKKEIDLRLKKMARDLGLGKNAIAAAALPPPQPSNIDTLKSLAPLLSKLAPEQLQGLVDRFLPEAEGEGLDVGGGVPDGLDGLLDFASKNPELVEGFLKGVKGGIGGEKEVTSQV